MGSYIWVLIISIGITFVFSKLWWKLSNVLTIDESGEPLHVTGTRCVSVGFVYQLDDSLVSERFINISQGMELVRHSRHSLVR